MRQWPAQISELIEDRFGPAPEVHQLCGMGGAAVVRIEGRGRSAVLKRGLRPVETHIYTVMAKQLSAHGVGMPELCTACKEDGAFWLVLEDMRQPFPRHRWDADEEQLGMVRRLHGIAPGSVDLHPDAYRPEWRNDMTESALSLFDPPITPALAATLETMRAATLSLIRASLLDLR